MGLARAAFDPKAQCPQPIIMGGIVPRVKQSGIYAIENTVNGKLYFGSTVDRVDRWRRHKRYLRQNKHQNRHLQRAWNQYGEAAFRFVWMQDVPADQLLDVEQTYLDTFTDTYNIAKFADAPNRGRKVGPISREARERQAAALRGKPKSEEHIRHIRESHNDDWREAVRQRLLGVKHSPERTAKTRLAVQAAMKRPEVIAKLRAGQQRRHHREREQRELAMAIA